MVAAGGGAALSQILAQVRADIARIDTNLQRGVDFDAGQGQRLSSEIAATRRHAARMAYSLNHACLLLAVMATVLAVTEVRRSARILRELGRAQQERADLFEQRCIELEQFGDRVAHDIMSPLAGVSVALAVAQKTSGSDPDARRIIDRGLATLLRVRRMVDGLLEFARSGAHPERAVDTDVHAVLNDVVEGIEACQADRAARS